MDGPGLDEPAADGGITPIAVGTVSDVQVAFFDIASSTSTPVSTGGQIDWEYRKIKRLDIRANVSQLHDGYLQVTVAPGLSINSHSAGGGLADPKQITDDPASKGLPGYTGLKSGQLRYQINTMATEIYLAVTLQPDALLMPKAPASNNVSELQSWLLNNAIKIEFLDADQTTVDGGVDINANITKDSSDLSPSWGQLYSSDANTIVPNVVNQPFSLKTYNIASNLHGSVLGAYYKKLTFTMPIPQVNGVYAQYKGVTITPGAAQSPTVETSGNEVTFTWTDLCLNSANLLITPQFQWTSVPDGTEATIASAPKVETTYYDGGSGRTCSLLPSGDHAKLMKYSVKGAIEIEDRPAVRGDIYNSGTDKTYQLGQFLVGNGGYDRTGALVLTFTYKDQETAHVTAQGIPVGGESGSVTSITYKTNLHPEGVTAVIDSSNYRNTGNNRTYMLMAPKGDYFTEIVARIPGFPAKYQGYNNSAAASPGNGAVFYGVPVDGSTTGNFTATLAITNDTAVGNTTSINASATVTSRFQNTTDSSTQMAVIPTASTGFFSPAAIDLAKSTGDAGDGVHTAHFSGYIRSTEYPYTGNQFVNDPVIYVRLPETITVEDSGWKITPCQTDGTGAVQTGVALSFGDDYTVEDHAERGGDKHHVYVIKFKNNAGKLGNFNSMLGETRLKLEFDADIGVSTPDMTLKVRDTVFVDYNESGTPPIQDSGSLSTNQVKDPYNVTGRGTNVVLSTAVEQTDLTISATRVGLVFNSYARLKSEGDTAEFKNHKLPSENNAGMTTDGHIMYLTQDKDELQFLFTAENNSEDNMRVTNTTLGQEDFYYYIPVPKIGDKWDEHIQDEEFQLALKLENSVEVTGEGHELFTVQYSTEAKPDNFNSNDSGTIRSLYYDSPKTGNWSDVNMIRISVRSGVSSIPVGTSVEFHINYSFELETSELVGYAIEFGPCGQTSYTRNGEASSGHSPTQRIRAEIQTGRIAGRVFVDADYSGGYTADDYLIEFKDGADPSKDHGAFLDRNGNGTQDGIDEIDVTMDLHAVNSTGDLTHYAQKPTFEDNPYNNTYAISGLRAEEYTLYVENPGYNGGVIGENSLRFISLAEGGGTRTVKEEAKTPPASTYETGYLKHTTATISITDDTNNITDNRMRDIALQRPHKVTFKVTYADEYGGTAHDPIEKTVYVWHDETMTESGVGIPKFDLEADFQMEQWQKDGTAVENPLTVPITEDTTFTATAVRVPHTITYDANGGTGGPPSKTAVFGESVTLDTANKPTHGNQGDTPVVFIGWSKDKVEKVYDRGDVQNLLTDTLVTEVKMGDENIIVYALWGVDSNNNHTADVLEDRYTLTYDANAISGNTSGIPAQVTNLLTGETVTLASEPKPTHDAVDGKTVLFVGWTNAENRFTDIISKNYSGKSEVAGKLLGSSYTMPAGNVTVYAVWAYDENGNNTPDYQETLHPLTYDPNGGTLPAGLQNNESYLPGITVDLWKDLASGTESAWSRSTPDGKAVFVGWSEMQKADVLVSKPKDSGVTIVEQVIMPTGNKTVYAVWAYDRNGNGTPDYDETLVTISFDANGGKDPSTGAAGSLAPIPGLLPGTVCSLPGRRTIKWRKEWIGGSPPAVFTGWSSVQINGIVDQDGKCLGLSVNDILVKEPYLVPTGNVTLYAVYAADEDGDGEPDYLTNAVHVEYYANGGQAAGSHITVETDGHFFTCGHHHVPHQPDVALLTAEETGHMIRRDGSIFLGWSLKADLSPCQSADDVKAAGIVSTVTMPDSGNIKVYAVWAADVNGNGTADYEEPHYTLTYDANGGDNAPASQTDILTDTSVTLSSDKPKKAGAVFLGWSADARAKGMLYKDGPDVALLPAGSTLNITEDVTLYAVWAKDASVGGTLDHSDPIPTASPASSAAVATVPNTGDESHAALWVALLVLCFGALAWVLRRLRRYRG